MLAGSLEGPRPLSLPAASQPKCLESGPPLLGGRTEGPAGGAGRAELVGNDFLG